MSASLAPYAILTVGHIRAFSAMVALATAVAMAYALFPVPMAWAAFWAGAIKDVVAK